MSEIKGMGMANDNSVYVWRACVCLCAFDWGLGVCVAAVGTRRGGDGRPECGSQHSVWVTIRGCRYTMKGTVAFLRAEMERPPWYPACPTEKCGKKLVMSMAGSWTCEKVGSC